MCDVCTEFVYIHLEYLAFCTLPLMLLHSHFKIQKVPDILQTQAQLPYLMHYTKKQKSFKDHGTRGELLDYEVQQPRYKIPL